MIPYRAYCAAKRLQQSSTAQAQARPAAAAHAMIVHPHYAQLILNGDKTVEARLLKARSGPYPAAHEGDELYIRTRGHYVAKARISRVQRFDNLTPAAIDSLRLRYNNAVHGEDAFWQEKAHARYAVLLWLSDVAPSTTGPRVRFAPRQAWLSISSARRA